MSSERRQAARILTDFTLILTDEKGKELDGRALAHDVSDKGFKVETQAELAKGQTLRFRLGLPEGREVSGRARVVWSHKEELAWWAGAEFVGLSWGERRRIRRVTSPSDVDWGVIADKAIVALSLLLATSVGWIAFTSPVWRAVLEDVFPKAVAAVVMGVALRVLLSR
ncbi:MAG: PilZ domain-containing protein [Elusimicrobia bacterium]|nr:PilZ domain-containing protein [Elusimicrobiota bacterium]